MTYDPDDDQHQRDKDDYAQGLDLDPEPPEEDRPPFDVEAARAAWESSRDEPMRVGPSVRAALDALPAALDEIEKLRRDLAYWRSLPIRQEYAITEADKPSDATGWLMCANAREAEMFAGKGGVPWVRSLTEHGWQRYENAPPF